MITGLSQIDWIQLDDRVQQVIEQEVQIIPLSPGLEASVMRIEMGEQRYVLKVWDKDSKPDIAKQYRLLSKLYQSGIGVSQPCGWGFDDQQNQVLLTSYDGEPVTLVTQPKLTQLAERLMEVHRYPVNRVGVGEDEAYISRYDFVEYFFPQIESHGGINDLLANLIQHVQIRQECLIHGDYNLGNILEMDGHYTIIDWTNGQYGDPRYDIAWSVFLITIYNGERYGEVYRAQFARSASYVYTLEEEQIFGAIACLRWILLRRVGHVPMGPDVMERVHSIAVHNPYLNEHLL
ncbi:aminoglycoside phosphotransferase family protein [Paenibacillus sp. 1781tsa1]|uniref:aminoglycoside phosphotransferase family protein n=1 Tax=Paenibacillus sp. 1781tsa1 TaxID=2953810 RepID=UPI0020A0BF7C|nr:aminoglycoside phosphotransferase family protein [Paenibacillus sp. 1781tsa1]MCP1186074.1 aminoglycoside phosphotransferase family protein [Paenibacillus sp. 1781tsa1]